jgi:ATP-dependent helicase/nuclease subunit A
MQYIDYSRCGSAQAVAEEIERLKNMRLITGAQAAAVNPDKIAAFFASPLGRRVLNADKVIREFKFSLLVPAARYYKGGSGVYCGGVLMCIEEVGQLTVMD